MSDVQQAPGASGGLLHQLGKELRGDVVSTTRNWWLLLVTGTAWVVIAIVVLRFNYASVATIATLFGCFCFLAAANEVLVGAISSRGWMILHWLLAVLFVAVGVAAVFPARRHVRRFGRGDELLLRFQGFVRYRHGHCRQQVERVVGFAAGRARRTGHRVLGCRVVEGIGRVAGVVRGGRRPDPRDWPDCVGISCPQGRAGVGRIGAAGGIEGVAA